MSGGPRITPAQERAAVALDRLGETHRARVGRAVSAAHALSDALWEALHEQLGDRSRSGGAGEAASLSTKRVSEISEGLADVAAAVKLLATACADVGARRMDAPPAEPPTYERDDRAGAFGHEPPPTASPAPQRPHREAPGRTRPARAFEAGASLVDELEGTASLVDDGAGAASSIGDAEPAASSIASIERASERFERDRLPFALMLVELTDVEHAGGEPPVGTPPRLAGQIEEGFMQLLRAITGGPGGWLTRERLGRYWLLMPETDRAGAQKLVERFARAAEQAAGAAGGNDLTERYFAALSARMSARPAARRATPLKLAVGIALCPEDGRGARALASRAVAALSSRGAIAGAIAAVDEPS